MQKRFFSDYGKYIFTFKLIASDQIFDNNENKIN